MAGRREGGKAGRREGGKAGRQEGRKAGRRDGRRAEGEKTRALRGTRDAIHREEADDDFIIFPTNTRKREEDPCGVF